MEARTLSAPIMTLVEPSNLSGEEPMAAAGSEKKTFPEQPLELSTRDSDPEVVLVDYEENDPENPLNWSPMHKWLIVFAISWMGFVR